METHSVKAPYASDIAIMPYCTKKVNILPIVRQHILSVDSLHTYNNKHGHLKSSHWVRDTRNCINKYSRSQDQFDWSPGRKCSTITYITNIFLFTAPVLFCQNPVKDTVLDHLNIPAQDDGNTAMITAVISERQIDQHSN